MAARLPSLYRVWVLIPSSVLAAKAAGHALVLVLAKGFRIARYCAMLCSYAMGQVAEVSLCAGAVRVNSRALKARNV